jgi:hypothetical protein
VKIKITTLRQQHDAAEEIAATIVSIIASYRDQYDAIPIARLVGKLNALLRVHFAYEDTVLYPSLMQSRDPDTAALAREFADEDASLAPQFEEFARRWSGPTIIAAMFDRFRDEATALLATLGARIERENDHLYPTAERIDCARAA